MVRQRDTTINYDLSYSEWHRTTGPKIYCTDVDMIEHAYIDGEPHPVAITDLKAVEPTAQNHQPIHLSRSSIRLQKNMADRLAVPFFIVVHYTAPAYEIKSFYVVPANSLAKRFFTESKIPSHFIDEIGVWMSERAYTQMLYALRGETAPIEILKSKQKITKKYSRPKIMV